MITFLSVDHHTHAVSYTLIEVDISNNNTDTNETGRILADAFGLDASCWWHVNNNNNNGNNNNNNNNNNGLPPLKAYVEAVIPDDEHGRARYAKSHERALQYRRQQVQQQQRDEHDGLFFFGSPES
jgi:hypothetical protein